MRNKFGKWLRQKRFHECMTLDEVARRAGTSKSYVHAIEAGESTPTIDKAAAITNVFNVSLWRVLKEVDI